MIFPDYFLSPAALAVLLFGFAEISKFTAILLDALLLVSEESAVRIRPTGGFRSKGTSGRGVLAVPFAG
jgi:hypothetical protein